MTACGVRAESMALAQGNQGRLAYLPYIGWSLSTNSRSHSGLGTRRRRQQCTQYSRKAVTTTTGTWSNNTCREK